MLKFTKSIFAVALAASFMFSCESEESISTSDAIPESFLGQLSELGFSTEGVIRSGEGYLVEGDIYLTEESVSDLGTTSLIPKVEQYSTNNLVTSVPRVITVYMPTGSKGFSSGEQAGLDEAIRRYNAEGINLTFQRSSSSSADIVFRRLSKRDERRGVLGSAGFPTSGGDPFGTISMSGILESVYGLSTDGIATIMAHEMGHCIGFRHTDYFDRSISCGGGTANEGDGGIGANHIPGTPTGADLSGNGSWMLACTDGSSRPFTSADKVALDYLY